VILYTCQDEDCAVKEEFWDVPGQFFECDQEGCSAVLLTGRKAWQIEVQLPDQTLTSAPFIKAGFYSHYKMVFLPDQLSVEFISASEPAVSNTTTITGPEGQVYQQLDLARAILFTILVEIPLAGLFLLIFRARFLDMLWILLGNVISLVVIWFLMPLLPFTALMVTLFSLFLSILIEWAVLGWLSGERITWLKAGLISLVINLASTMVGFLLVF
jgi:hypothetical protein